MQVTRLDVVQRAINIFPSIGYIWGAWPGTKPTQYCRYDEEQEVGVISDSGYIATDCSGFTSWCWALDYKRGSWSWSSEGEFGGDNYRARDSTAETLSYESLFPGIQPGDVLYRQGHVALYIGNETVLQATTGKWKATPTGRGCRISTNDFNFDGFCSFDSTFAVNYDPIDTNIDIDNVSDGEKGPNPWTSDVSAGDLYIRFYDVQYTRRYDIMKRWRRI